jgi:PAS domain S-box-containing protein
VVVRSKRTVGLDARNLEDALDLALLGVWTWEPDTDKVVVSRQVASLYGRSVAELADMDNLSEPVLPEDRKALEDAAAATLAGGPPYCVDYRVRRRDGELRWLQARGRLVPGKPRLMTGTIQDVTDRKQAEQERDAAATQAHEAERLRELNDFKARFINIAAHELKTPLTPMRIQLALLRDVGGAKLDDVQRRSLDVIARNLDRLNRLVEDVLQAARVQAHSLKLLVRPMDLSEVVRTVVESFQAGAEQAGVRVTTAVQPDLRIEADSTRMEQVVSNLFTNAVKFTPEGGTVHVEAYKEGNEVVLAVQDTGIGMDGDQVGRLFVPFSQVHNDPSQRLRGTGLGLFICKGIVEDHGGSIKATSPGPGKGARFEVRMRGTRKEVAPTPPPSRPTAAKRFRELI